MPDPQLITADLILPMSPAFPRTLQNAGLIIEDGRITAIADLSELRNKFGNLPPQHHPGLLLPGLINAHTHLELSNLAGKLTGGGAHKKFPDWVTALLNSIPKEAAELEQFVRTSVRTGIQQSLAAGVTAIGDISRNFQISRNEITTLAQQSPTPRIISFAEITALGKMRSRLTPTLDAATSNLLTPNSSRLTPIPGLSPHAPYTVEGPALRAILRQAIIHRLPIAMHLAEHKEETDFLRDLSGPLGKDWPLMQNLLDDQIPLAPAHASGPIRWAQLHGLLIADKKQNHVRDFPVLLAHVNYADNNELAQLAASNASVAYCPRTHEFFNHPPHRYNDMLAAGINVCLATDSLASNPDLNLLKEAALLVKRDHLDPYLALQLITTNPARALAIDAGSLDPLQRTDLAIFPVQSLEELLTTTPAPSALYLNGTRAF